MRNFMIHFHTSNDICNETINIMKSLTLKVFNIILCDSKICIIIYLYVLI